MAVKIAHTPFKYDRDFWHVKVPVVKPAPGLPDRMTKVLPDLTISDWYGSKIENGVKISLLRGEHVETFDAAGGYFIV